MGMFKDAKNAASSLGNIAETTAAASQAANAYAETFQAGLTEGSYDPNDPAFAPIEGVDLDAYAKAVSAVTKSGAQTEEDAAKAAEKAGIPKGKWKTINDGWIARMRESRAVMNRYGILYQQQG
jgi:hypothetical protein